MTPDVIVCWPRTCDYPLWREFITRERERFAKVIVVFTDHDGPVDYRDFVRWALPDVTCVDSPERHHRDWRDVAVNHALTLSDAEYVWFTEQDFLITDPTLFWERMDLVRRVLGFRDETRWHPASLLVQRRLIDRTLRYFGPDPVDHFYTFSRELDELTLVDQLPTSCFEHLQGLSQNHHLIDNDIDAGVFKRERFRQYLRDCLAVHPLQPQWAANARRELKEGSARP